MASHTLTITFPASGTIKQPLISTVVFTAPAGVTSQAQLIAHVRDFVAEHLTEKLIAAGAYA